MSDVMQWRPWFAWRPVRTNSGVAWLSMIERRWNNDLSPWGDTSGYSGTDGRFEYRKLKNGN